MECSANPEPSSREWHRFLAGQAGLKGKIGYRAVLSYRSAEARAGKM
jgi:hypothetical protein